jgi:hypothetical protein
MNALQFYRHMRHAHSLPPRLACVATVRLYAQEDFAERYGRIVNWYNGRATKVDPAIIIAQEEKTAGLKAAADYCRDRGYGVARRDKLGLVTK